MTIWLGFKYGRGSENVTDIVPKDFWCNKNIIINIIQEIWRILYRL